MMQMTHFKLLFWLSSNAPVSVRLFLYNFARNTGPSHGSYRFYMLLCVAIQSEIFAFGISFRVFCINIGMCWLFCIMGLTYNNVMCLCIKNVWMDAYVCMCQRV